jgi:hypothetical protein
MFVCCEYVLAIATEHDHCCIAAPAGSARHSGKDSARSVDLMDRMGLNLSQGAGKGRKEVQ